MKAKQKILILAITAALSLGTSNALFAAPKEDKANNSDKGKPVAEETTVTTTTETTTEETSTTTSEDESSDDTTSDESSSSESDDNTSNDATTVDTGKKTLVCHNGQTLEVAKAALGGHLGHGDTEGACPVAEPTTTEEDTTVTDEETVTEEDTTVADEETVTEEDTTVADEETVTEEDTTVIDEETVTEEDTTVTDEETVTEEDTTVTEDETVTEEDTTVTDEETTTEEDTTVAEEEVLEPEQLQLRQALDTVGEELVATEEPTEQLALLEEQPIERTFYSEQHDDIAYLPKVSINMLGQLVTYAVLMKGMEYVDENGEIGMEYVVTAVNPIDATDDANTADYSADSNVLDVPVVDVVDESGMILSFKVTLEMVSSDPLVFRIKLSQTTDDTATPPTEEVVDTSSDETTGETIPADETVDTSSDTTTEETVTVDETADTSSDATIEETVAVDETTDTSSDESTTVEEGSI